MNVSHVNAEVTLRKIFENKIKLLLVNVLYDRIFFCFNAIHIKNILVGNFSVAAMMLMQNCIVSS